MEEMEVNYIHSYLHHNFDVKGNLFEVNNWEIKSGGKKYHGLDILEDISLVFGMNNDVLYNALIGWLKISNFQMHHPYWNVFWNRYDAKLHEKIDCYFTFSVFRPDTKILYDIFYAYDYYRYLLNFSGLTVEESLRYLGERGFIIDINRDYVHNMIRVRITESDFMHGLRLNAYEEEHLHYTEIRNRISEMRYYNEINNIPRNY